MVMFAVDALTVFLLLKAVSGKETGFWTAGIIGLCAGALTTVLSIRLTSAIGNPGIVAAIPIAGALLGLSLAWFCEVKLKAACIAATIFVVVHITINLLIAWMLRQP
jgi:hypothetical protein